MKLSDIRKNLRKSEGQIHKVINNSLRQKFKPATIRLYISTCVRFSLDKWRIVIYFSILCQLKGSEPAMDIRKASTVIEAVFK